MLLHDLLHWLWIKKIQSENKFNLLNCCFHKMKDAGNE